MDAQTASIMAAFISAAPSAVSTAAFVAIPFGTKIEDSAVFLIFFGFREQFFEDVLAWSQDPHLHSLAYGLLAGGIFYCVVTLLLEVGGQKAVTETAAIDGLLIPIPEP